MERSRIVRPALLGITAALACKRGSISSLHVKPLRNASLGGPKVLPDALNVSAPVAEAPVSPEPSAFDDPIWATYNDLKDGISFQYPSVLVSK